MMTKQGLTPLQIMQIRQIADKNAKEHEAQAIKTTFKLVLAIVLNVLIADYWPKAGKQKTRKFIDKCTDLYEVWIDGHVSEEQIDEFLYEYGGVKIDEI